MIFCSWEKLLKVMFSKIRRGGEFNNDNTGVFNFHNWALGNSNGNVSFRLVMMTMI